MSRKDDLEQAIRESEDLISQYQTIIRESSDPKERAHARREIAEQRELIEVYRVELDALTEDAMPSQVVESGTTQFPAGVVRGDAAVRQPSAEPNSTTEAWDVFISHASEDKPFVRHLANALIDQGLRVWYDELTLRVGDSLRRRINYGLANSRYGVVVLSPHFFAKEWPQKELDGLTARESTDTKIVLPVWHNITLDEVRRYSPVLADRLAVSSDRGIEYVVEQLMDAIAPKVSNSVLPRRPFEPEMILIPAGEFLMGSDPQEDSEARDHEQPQHPVHLPDYFIGKTPVTNAQYLAFVQANSYRWPPHWGDQVPRKDIESHPVVHVGWSDVLAYCGWLGETTGRSYQLPSEAQWEKAARGVDGYIYPWGNHWDASRCNSVESGQGDTTPVDAYPSGASPYGILDMAGNVWEWTRSLDRSYPYDSNDGREGKPTSAETVCVLRGGAFFNSARSVRCAVRNSVLADFGCLGFRVCVEL